MFSDPENMTDAMENNLELLLPLILQEYTNNQHKNHKLPDKIDYQSNHPITNSNLHLCLFDSFSDRVVEEYWLCTSVKWNV